MATVVVVFYCRSNLYTQYRDDRGVERGREKNNKTKKRDGEIGVGKAEMVSGTQM